MTSDSGLFMDHPDIDCFPLYEAKQIHHFDHRWASYNKDKSIWDATLAEKQDHDFCVVPRYWVAKRSVIDKLAEMKWDRRWLIGWRDITSAHVLRTAISTVFPLAGVGNQMPLIFFDKSHDCQVIASFIGNVSSLVYDFLARQKVGGNHLNIFIFRQIPVLPPSTYTQATIDFIQPRVLELTYTAHDLKPWAEDLGYDGPAFRFDPERRSLLRAELDAFYAHLYGLNRDELRYILDPADVMGPDYPSETFRVLKNNEQRQFGEYRTQRLVLEAWDRLFG
jgi:hypothetical protein